MGLVAHGMDVERTKGMGWWDSMVGVIYVAV